MASVLSRAYCLIQTDTKFGVCKINENNDYFASAVDWTTRKEREPATVSKVPHTKFLVFWKDLEAQVAEELATGKTVLFTGHNIGGGIATLATLASLEKWGKGAPVYAITFGFPLIGDEILARAARRQGWDNHFYNVVSKSDIFARTLLAPCISVSAFLEALLPYWHRSVQQMNGGDTDILMEPADVDFKKYMLTVLHHASAVVNLSTVNNMEPGNKLIASLKPAVKLSPYRPFGYYLFCSEKGALFVENYGAVLPILFYSLASAQNEVSISDHTDYGRVFHGNTSMVNLEGIQNLPLSQGAALASPMEMQLDALGLSIQIAEALATGKTVVFTGHNIGGGIADLATIASLEKWGKGAPVSAITFGFPLIGDEILARAVRRQGWDNHFYNVVSKRDGFASTLLAPCISVSGFMEALLPYWQKSVEQMNSGDTDIIMEPADLDYKKYVLTVLHHACAVVNLTTVNNMEPGNKLIASLKPAVKLSPYRPFGYYLFCSEKGALFVENYEAVLPILFYSLASAQDEVSISDHTGYGKVFHGNTSMVNLEGLQNLPLSQGAALASPIEIQLNALGLGIQNTRARLALRAAGEAEQKLIDNRNKLKEELAKLVEGARGKETPHMTKLKEYRSNCFTQRNIGYYDAFREQKEKVDFQANLNRLNLAATYDKLEEMVETHQVPDDFHFIEELIKEGTEYRLLVEPLDVANYYRLGKHEDSGHYMRNARPRRYKALEKWLADIKPEEKMAVISGLQDITKDSCFWAHVEEVSWIMSNPKENAEVKRTKCSEFENYVKQLLERNELIVQEVKAGDSTFVKWWNKLRPQEKQASPIAYIF